MMMENRMMTGNRVDCLYRVSTDKQVDYNDKSQADIPMQRRECHRFCEKMGWTIVHESRFYSMAHFISCVHFAF